MGKYTSSAGGMITGKAPTGSSPLTPAVGRWRPSHPCSAARAPMAASPSSRAGAGDSYLRQEVGGRENSGSPLLPFWHLHVNSVLTYCPFSCRNKTFFKGRVCVPAQASFAWRSNAQYLLPAMSLYKALQHFMLLHLPS